MLACCIITNKNNPLIAAFCKRLHRVFRKTYKFVVLFDARNATPDETLWKGVDVFSVTWQYLEGHGIDRAKCTEMSALSSQGSTWFGICYALDHDYKHCYVFEDDVTCSSARSMHSILKSYDSIDTDLICACPPMHADIDFYIRFRMLYSIEGTHVDETYQHKYWSFTFAYRISKTFAAFFVDKYSKLKQGLKLCHHEVALPTECINNGFSVSSFRPEHVSRWGDGVNPLSIATPCQPGTLCHPNKYWNREFHVKCQKMRLLLVVIGACVAVIFIHIIIQIRRGPRIQYDKLSPSTRKTP